MKYTKENFKQLRKSNLELESKIISLKKNSNLKRLNESQKISQTGSWSWDVVNDKSEWSDTMYRMLGLEPLEESPTYALALKYVHKDDKIEYERTLAEAISKKGDFYFENRIVQEDGSIINVISRGTCFCDEKGELIRIAGTIQDVTIITALKEPNKQLDQFANILSHDFKTPIRNIISFIGLFKRSYFEDLPKEAKEYITFIDSGARRLSELVNDILDYSKLNAPKSRSAKILMLEFVKSVTFDLNMLLLEKEGTITISWLPEYIIGDRVEIRQVLQNLVANAIKYSRKDVKPDIEIFCTETKTEYIFYINDKGIGIDPLYIATIFEPYIKVHNETSFSGTGIGLSISKRIIELHKGSLGYTANKDGIGSSFHFSLPKTRA